MDEKGKISKYGSAGACRLTCHKTTAGHAVSMISIPIRLQLQADKVTTLAERKMEVQEIEKVRDLTYRLCLNNLTLRLLQTLFAVCKYLKPTACSSSDEVK